jgi:two-component system, NtrC family, response regulator AtoC
MHILLVEEDDAQRRLLSQFLESEGGIRVDAVSDGPAALARFSKTYGAVIATLGMRSMDGIELVRRVRAESSSVLLILLAEGATVERAVDAMRAGASDFLPKPVSSEALLRLVCPDGKRSRSVPVENAAPTAADAIVGNHAHLDSVRTFARRVARVPEARVLIGGESGTGKSSLARVIHESAGGRGRFVEVSCATLPPSLIESELFGHEKGAFTDAKAMKRGLVELANGGTLFLDEIGTLPLDMQAKLLLFLESRQIRRVGGNEPISSSARVIAASNEDLAQAVRDGRFRGDLLYRLDVAAVRMPALREMPEVLPDLAARFVQEISAQFKRPAPKLSTESVGRLRDYDWPGNARELRNVVERALIFHEGGELELQLPSAAAERRVTIVNAVPAGVVMPRGITLEDVERRYIEDAMSGYRGDLSTLAASLGISRKTLWDKRRRYSAQDAALADSDLKAAPPVAGARRRSS